MLAAMMEDLDLMLPLARGQGLPYIELTTDEENLPSQSVILANGGRFIARFAQPAAYGGGKSLGYRIDLDSEALCRHWFSSGDERRHGRYGFAA